MDNPERRIDWLLRQFIDDIIFRLKFENLRPAEAEMLMKQRLVPQHVQDRVLDRIGMEFQKWSISKGETHGD